MAFSTSFCSICSEMTSGKYCAYHRRSFDKLVSCYQSWKRALGEISWRDFLRKVIELQDTGSSIRDIIQKELQ